VRADMEMPSAEVGGEPPTLGYPNADVIRVVRRHGHTKWWDRMRLGKRRDLTVWCPAPLFGKYFRGHYETNGVRHLGDTRL
jgi:hypothetical protein